MCKRIRAAIQDALAALGIGWVYLPYLQRVEKKIIAKCKEISTSLFRLHQFTYGLPSISNILLIQRLALALSFC